MRQAAALLALSRRLSQCRVTAAPRGACRIIVDRARFSVRRTMYGWTMLSRSALFSAVITTVLIAPAVAQESDIFDPFAALRLQLVRDVEIRAGINDATLARPEAILADSNRIYVLDPSAPGVLSFDRDGIWRGTIGREGEGPGEFRHPSSMGWLSDTLWVADRDLARLSFFDRDMDYVNSVSFRVVSGWTLAIPRAALGPWVLAPPYVATRVETREDSIPLLVFERTGEARNTLAWTMAGQNTVSARVASQNGDETGQLVSVRHPFDERGMMAYDPRSRWVCLGTWRMDSNGKSYLELVRIAADGDTLSAADVPLERTSATTADVRSYARKVYREAPQELKQGLSASTLTRAFLSQIVDPSIAAVDAMLASEDGTVLLRRTSWIDEVNEGAPERWAMFRWREGFLGHIVLPMGESMIAATGGLLWSVSEDPFGLPSIKGWNLTSAAGG